MRAYDRDLIRGGHYGQRPRAIKGRTTAPTKAANVEKVLANSEHVNHLRTNRAEYPLWVTSGLAPSLFRPSRAPNVGTHTCLWTWSMTFGGGHAPCTHCFDRSFRFISSISRFFAIEPK